MQMHLCCMFGIMSTFNVEDQTQTQSMANIDIERCRYPFCIVWTPIPVLTWIFPFLGHMGICTSNGVIRDFAGPYYVSEDSMAFGKPTKYWQLSGHKVHNGAAGWDSAVAQASDIYKHRMHNLLCDNCHSHVAMALNIMNYNSCSNWNMVKLAIGMILFSKYVSWGGFMRTWLPWCVLATLLAAAVVACGLTVRDAPP